MFGLKLLLPILFLCHLFCTTSVECVRFEDDVKITFEQKAIIDKLRARVRSQIVEDYMKEDIYLVKRLRSTNFDLLQAEKKFIENIRWRKVNNMTTIEKEDHSAIADEYPYLDSALDKEGRPVMIAFVGDWNIRAAIVTGQVHRVLRYLNQGMEMLARKVRLFQKEGKNVTQASLILDLSEASLVTHACVQCLVRIVEFVTTYENHYPGLADKVWFVDTPPAVHFVLEIVKESVSKETRDAIRVYGTNKDQWKRAILDIIDKSYVPIEFGGTLERN